MAASSKANTALLLTLGGFCFLPLAFVGVILGIVALLEFKREVIQEGKGKAIAAVVIGGLPVLALAVGLLTVAITAYASTFNLSRALLSAIIASAAGAIAGASFSMVTCKYQMKGALGPLSLGLYWMSSKRLRKTFIRSEISQR
jgi:hypothetical protein